ncbi:hypothetical protein [Azospirillum sp. ST 5-10]|uniref:hypothetical protein n=1 Tax=unclassified Azospirillum TaxID=2630922 RepID=UPI003F4A343A
MSRTVSCVLSAVLSVLVAGCAGDYSPGTYSANAVQQANKVERAVVVGFREVKISTNGTVGAVTGGAAGGILGSQAEGLNIDSALGAVGGTAIGSLIGTSIEHVTGDTTGWEYIVRKDNGDLLSVTQREEAPIPIGQKVLVITGNQARVVPDYSVTPEPEARPASPEPAKPETLAQPAEPETPARPAPDARIEVQEIPAPEPVPAGEPAASVPPAGGEGGPIPLETPLP